MRKASDLDARKVKSPNPESRNRGTFTRTKARGERERQREGSVKPTRFLPSLTSCAGDAARHGLPEEMLHGGPKTGALLEGSVRDCKLLIGCACNN